MLLYRNERQTWAHGKLRGVPYTSSWSRARHDHTIPRHTSVLRPASYSTTGTRMYSWSHSKTREREPCTYDVEQEEVFCLQQPQ